MNKKMILIIKNEKYHAILQKEHINESWFNYDCSDERIQKELNRTENIKAIKFEDVNGIADRLNVYFE